jgi:hypothetical protein
MQSYNIFRTYPNNLGPKRGCVKKNGVGSDFIYRESCLSSYFFHNVLILIAKVIISEENTKGNNIFSFYFRAKTPSPRVKGNENREKYQK